MQNQKMNEKDDKGKMQDSEEKPLLVRSGTDKGNDKVCDENPHLKDLYSVFPTASGQVDESSEDESGKEELYICNPISIFVPPATTKMIDRWNKSNNLVVGPFKLSAGAHPHALGYAMYLYDYSFPLFETILRMGNLKLTRWDFQGLAPGRPMFSKVVSAWSMLLTKETRAVSSYAETKMWFLPTGVSMAEVADTHVVKRALETRLPQQFFGSFEACEIIAAPLVDLRESHMFVIIVHVDKNVVQVWDPLDRAEKRSRRLGLVKTMMRTLSIMMDAKFGEFRRGFSFNNFEVQFADNIPQQSYSIDCGVYVMKFLKSVSLCHTVPLTVNVNDDRFWFGYTLYYSPWNREEKILNVNIVNHYRNCLIKYNSAKAREMVRADEVGSSDGVGS